MAGFSFEWDNCYSKNTQMSLWPWSDVVSLVHRFCKPLLSNNDGAGAKVLEMGCGAGANIPFFKSLGLKYKAIEGSSIIVHTLHQRYPDLVNNIICGDFTSLHPYDNDFDLILDRAAITHNNTKSIKDTLSIVFDSLIDGGLFVGVDWFSTKHSDIESGILVDDNFTRTDFSQGQFVGVGKVHFSDEKHIRELFQNFEILFMEEKVTNRYEPHDDHRFASWNIVVRKGNA